MKCFIWNYFQCYYDVYFDYYNGDNYYDNYYGDNYYDNYYGDNDALCMENILIEATDENSCAEKCEIDIDCFDYYFYYYCYLYVASEVKGLYELRSVS